MDRRLSMMSLHEQFLSPVPSLEARGGSDERSTSRHPPQRSQSKSSIPPLTKLPITSPASDSRHPTAPGINFRAGFPNPAQPSPSAEPVLHSATPSAIHRDSLQAPHSDSALPQRDRQALPSMLRDTVLS